MLIIEQVVCEFATKYLIINLIVKKQIGSKCYKSCRCIIRYRFYLPLGNSDFRYSGFHRSDYREAYSLLYSNTSFGVKWTVYQNNKYSIEIRVFNETNFWALQYLDLIYCNCKCSRYNSLRVLSILLLFLFFIYLFLHGLEYPPWLLH